MRGETRVFVEASVSSFECVMPIGKGKFGSSILDSPSLLRFKMAFFLIIIYSASSNH